MEGVKLSLARSATGLFPEDVNLSELESVVRESFATRNMMVIPEYFIHGTHYSPTDISFMVIGRDQSGKIVSGLIARELAFEETKFIYYDKIFVDPGHRRQGLMGNMISKAIDESRTMEIPIAALRTSDEEYNKMYANHSDINHIQVGDYYMHGFGFLNKKTNTELFADARNIFRTIAGYIAKKPATTIPVQPSAVPLIESGFPAYS